MKSIMILVNSLLLASVVGIPTQALEAKKPIPTPIETPHTTPSHDQGIKDNSMKGCEKSGITGRTKVPEQCANIDQLSVEDIDSENTSSSDAAKAAGIPGIKAKSVRKQPPQ
jgi:hypothetical protein